MCNVWRCLKLLFLWFISLLSLSLVWCGDGWNNWNKFVLSVAWYSLVYNWNVKLWKVALKTDDLNEIIDLYQEIWDNIWFRDSLLVAEKYDQWLWINAFVQSNLDVLEEQWLLLSDVKKTQVKLETKSGVMNAVLVEYKITEWFIDKVPLLYFAQLFIPDGHSVKLVSFITESSTSHSSALSMLKNIN